VLENLELVARCICRCRLLEKLYLEGHPAAAAQFQASMVQLYGSILLYLCKAKGYFETKKSSKFLHTLLYVPPSQNYTVRIVSSAFRDKTEFEGFTKKISKDLEEVNQCAILISREGQFEYLY
jgi:hypothetical protein